MMKALCLEEVLDDERCWSLYFIGQRESKSARVGETLADIKTQQGDG